MLNIPEWCESLFVLFWLIILLRCLLDHFDLLVFSSAFVIIPSTVVAEHLLGDTLRHPSCLRGVVRATLEAFAAHEVELDLRLVQTVIADDLHPAVTELARHLVHGYLLVVELFGLRHVDEGLFAQGTRDVRFDVLAEAFRMHAVSTRIHNGGEHRVVHVSHADRTVGLQLPGAALVVAFQS